MKKLAAVFALLLAALALAACGSDGDNEESAPPKGVQETEKTEETEDGEAGGAGELSFEADPNGALAFTTDSATTDDKRITIRLINKSSVPHDVAIEEDGGSQIGKTEVIAEDETSTTVNMKSGDYIFYCSVPGHREAGMEGTLTVE